MVELLELLRRSLQEPDDGVDAGGDVPVEVLPPDVEDPPEEDPPVEDPPVEELPVEELPVEELPAMNEAKLGPGKV